MPKTVPRCPHLRSSLVTSVVYDIADNNMHCQLHKEQGKRTPWGGLGTNNFQLRTLTDHVKSADHRHAVAAKDQRHTWVNVSKDNVRWCNVVTLATQSCYWAVVQEVANCKYKVLLELSRSEAWLTHYTSSAVPTHRSFSTSWWDVWVAFSKRSWRVTPDIIRSWVLSSMSRDATCMTEFMDCVAVHHGTDFVLVK